MMRAPLAVSAFALVCLSCNDVPKLPQIQEAQRFFSAHSQDLNALADFGKANPQLELAILTPDGVLVAKRLELERALPAEQSRPLEAIFRRIELAEISFDGEGGATVPLGEATVDSRTFGWSLHRLPTRPSAEKICDDAVLEIPESWCLIWINDSWWLRYYWWTESPSAA